MSKLVPISIDSQSDTGWDLPKKALLSLMEGCGDALETLGELRQFVKAVKIATVGAGTNYKVRVVVAGPAHNPAEGIQLEAGPVSSWDEGYREDCLGTYISRSIFDTVLSHVTEQREFYQQQARQLEEMLPKA